jgi:hypothetical protein
VSAALGKLRPTASENPCKMITLVILRITWESWHTVRDAEIDLEHIDDDHYGPGHEHE